MQAQVHQPANGLHIIGSMEGFSPHIGTIVSMMSWMRAMVLRSVEKLHREQLDYLHDQDSNTIGAMLMHLVATEVFYKGNTFEGRVDFTDAEKARWGDAMSLRCGAEIYPGKRAQLLSRHIKRNTGRHPSSISQAR